MFSTHSPICYFNLFNSQTSPFGSLATHRASEAHQIPVHQTTFMKSVLAILWLGKGMLNHLATNYTDLLGSGQIIEQHESLVHLLRTFFFAQAN